PDDLAIADPVVAHTILRCVQEIVTNAVRHSAAANLWIDLVRVDQLLELRARDDGRGAEAIAPGHGLAGVRGRGRVVCGRRVLRPAPQEGFALTASLPLTGPAS